MWRRAPAILAAWSVGLAAAAQTQSDTSIEGALSVRPSSDDCIVAPALRARVQRWIQPGALQRGVSVEVNATAEPVSFSVRRGGNVVAERRFDVLPEACNDRLDAVALAVALAIEHASGMTNAGGAASVQPATSASTQPGQAAADKPAAAESAAGKPAIAEPPTNAAVAKSPTPTVPSDAKKAGASDDANAAAERNGSAARPSQQRERHLRLLADGTLLLGALPNPAIAVGAGAELDVSKHFHVGIVGLFALPTRTSLGQHSAQTELIGGRALLCATGPVAGVALDGCAGAASGAAIATGMDFKSNPTATMAWAAGVLRAGVRYPADGTVSLRLAVDGLVNAWRPKLRVTGAAKDEATGSTFGAAASVELLFALP